MKKPTNFVLYDDTCPLCTGQMKRIRRLDWEHAITPLAVSDPRVSEVAPQLKRDQLMASIHCVSARGKVIRGARCFRFIAMRIPVLMPLALLLWVPGVIYLAEWIYRLISRHRHQL